MGANSRHELLDVRFAKKRIRVNDSNAAEICGRSIRIDFSSLALELLYGFWFHHSSHAKLILPHALPVTAIYVPSLLEQRCRALALIRANPTASFASESPFARFSDWPRKHCETA